MRAETCANHVTTTQAPTAIEGSDPNYGHYMKRILPLFIAGAILVAIGLVWTLQGLNVLGGSVMSGSPLWATIGPIVLLIGVVVILVAEIVRRRRSR